MMMYLEHYLKYNQRTWGYHGILETIIQHWHATGVSSTKTKTKTNDFTDTNGDLANTKSDVRFKMFQAMDASHLWKIWEPPTSTGLDHL